MLYGLKDAADFAVTRKSDNKRVLWANYCQTSSISFTADSTIGGVNEHPALYVCSTMFVLLLPLSAVR